MASRLTKETITAIRSENKLQLQVAEALGIQLATLPAYLTNNRKRFMEYPVLKVIADYTGKTPDDLIEEYDDSTESDNIENIKQTA